MGKNLIIKGADFSENSIPQPVVVWNNEYRTPTNTLFTVSTTNSIIGPNYEEGTKIDGIKLSLIPKNSPASGMRNLISGDIINIYLVDKSSPYSKTVIGSYTVTQSDLDNLFAIIPIDSIVIPSSKFLAFGAAVLEEEGVYLPISISSSSDITIPGYFVTANNDRVNTHISGGIATYYLT